MENKKITRIQTGKTGEDVAVDYLRAQHLRIIGRNIRTAYGEIDILCEGDSCLIFVEVKTRRTKQFGFPEAAVDRNKQEHMINSANAYLQENDLLDHGWRIDVVSVNLYSLKSPQIQWFKNAITC